MTASAKSLRFAKEAEIFDFSASPKSVHVSKMKSNETALRAYLREELFEDIEQLIIVAHSNNTNQKALLRMILGSLYFGILQKMEKLKANPGMAQSIVVSDKVLNTINARLTEESRTINNTIKETSSVKTITIKRYRSFTNKVFRTFVRIIEEYV